MGVFRTIRWRSLFEATPLAAMITASIALTWVALEIGAAEVNQAVLS